MVRRESLLSFSVNNHQLHPPLNLDNVVGDRTGSRKWVLVRHRAEKRLNKPSIRYECSLPSPAVSASPGFIPQWRPGTMKCRSHKRRGVGIMSVGPLEPAPSRCHAKTAALTGTVPLFTRQPQIRSNAGRPCSDSSC